MPALPKNLRFATMNISGRKDSRGARVVTVMLKGRPGGGGGGGAG